MGVLAAMAVLLLLDDPSLFTVQVKDVLGGTVLYSYFASRSFDGPFINSNQINKFLSSLNRPIFTSNDISS